MKALGIKIKKILLFQTSILKLEPLDPGDLLQVESQLNLDISWQLQLHFHFWYLIIPF
jgi:uncharacterized membrane-anchored protein